MPNRKKGGTSISRSRTVVIFGSLALMAFFDDGNFEVYAEGGVFDNMHNSRNEYSTPRNSILPVSPAIADLKLNSEKPIGQIKLLRSKALLMYLGYDVGRLDGRVTAKFKAAVFKYQKAHKLAATGELDDTTFKRLRGQTR